MVGWVFVADRVQRSISAFLVGLTCFGLYTLFKGGFNRAKKRRALREEAEKAQVGDAT